MYGKEIPFHRDVHLPRLLPGCESTVLGNLRGADEQFRCPDNVHIRRYGSEYRGHRDYVDPRHDFVGHLLADAPVETSIGVGVITTIATKNPVIGVIAGLATHLLSDFLYGDRR